MKTGIYFLFVLVTLCWYSCETPNTESQEGAVTTTVQEENGSTAATNETTTSAPATNEATGASKITDAVATKVCDCKKQATQEDGSIDNDVIRSCMGAESLPLYIEQLLGASASEKDRSDAENELMTRMSDC